MFLEPNFEIIQHTHTFLNPFRKRMQSKLDATRESLKSMTAHWREEWRNAAIKWSEQIIIAPINGRPGEMKCPDCVIFPTTFGTTDQRGHFFAYDPDTFIPSASTSSCHEVDVVLNWRNFSPEKDGLLNVPVNLAVDIFRHFALAFGCNISINRGNSQHYHQMLHVGGENKRHHEVIQLSLNNFSDSSDGWQSVWAQGIQLGGKLLPAHYIEHVLHQLRLHQMTKMIEHYFYRSDKSGEKIIATAKHFLLKSIYYRNASGMIEFINGLYNPIITLVGAANFKTEQKDLISNHDTHKWSRWRKIAKSFSLEDENSEHCPRHTPSMWNAAMKNKNFVNCLGELTKSDVQFLLCLVIDAEYDYQDSLSKVTRLSTTSTGFPTVADDFSNFDFPHLRGLFAETVLSRKLQSYALGKEEILSGDFAAMAPTALTRIVGDYYSIDSN